MSVENIDLRDLCHSCEDRIDDNDSNEFVHKPTLRRVFMCSKCAGEIESDVKYSQFYVRVL